MLKHIYSCCFVLVTSSIFGQYISSVTIPDTTKPVITLENDFSVPYAKTINASDLKEYLSIISSDSLQGRETGQPGIALAAEYISSFLTKQGISKIPNTDTYYQDISFTFTKWVDTDIFVDKVRFRHLWDYLTFPNLNTSEAIIMQKEVLFLGYGIDDASYSDYTKMDVKDKIIMINRGEPLKKDSTSYITKSRKMSSWSDVDMDRKLKVAKEKGVKLVLIIDNDIKKMLEDNRRKLLGSFVELGNTTEKPLLYPNHAYISSTVAKAIIGANEEKVIKARKNLAKGKPSSMVLPTDFIINMSKKSEVLEGKNIIGLIEGSTKKDEYVIVSAHYDHIGMKGDDVYNGADDNGSGTSTLMELAEAFQKAKMEGHGPERNVVFLWVCGEEKGLLGSQYYSENPIFPLKQTVVDVNVDMVGRVDDKYKDNPNYIYVIGSDRLSTDLHKINEDINQKYTRLTLDYTFNDEKDPNRFYYRSDHYNFAKNGVPAIFFFNGTHPDYHRATDTFDKINFDKMVNIGKLIFHTTWELANRPDRIRVDGTVR